MNKKAGIFLREDTIAAVATPPGRGAIAVIRLSGPRAISIGQCLFQSKGKSLTQHPRLMIHGAIVDPETQEIADEVLAAVFPAPHSYTGEEMMEIYCHGGEVVVRKILELLHRQGARFAEPGEFTFRAVRNGKMDLAQAEAVNSLIESRSQLARALSLRMLEGAFSKELGEVKEQLIAILAEVETQIEFPDDAVEAPAGSAMKSGLRLLWERIADLKRRSIREQRFQEGIAAVLAGKPNVGKSSLFNALLGRERAIVTPHPGTTRDSIEGVVELDGKPLTLIDTAGLRETQEEIEAIGVQRSLRLLNSSPIVLYIYDASQGLAPDDRRILDELRKSNEQAGVILVANKYDLLKDKAISSLEDEDWTWPVISASAIKEGGIDALIVQLEKETANRFPAEAGSAYLVNARQESLMSRMEERIRQAFLFLEEASPLEIIAEELRLALQELAELDGSYSTPDIIEIVFSRFCIGK
ncbi:MAG: tRNA uridine-5-carboxymethylaminomethyl(34) synthesis GTPase MnmE [Candidatus Omnitrophota bacterium]